MTNAAFKNVCIIGTSQTAHANAAMAHPKCGE